LYLKQYLTPTIILSKTRVSQWIRWHCATNGDKSNLFALLTYHRFVKTTPKPRATKKRSGELVGPPPPPPPAADVVGPGGAEEIALGAADMVEEDDGALPGA